MIVWIATFLILILYVCIQKAYVKYWDYKLKVEVLFVNEFVHEGESSRIQEVIINDKYMLLPVLETRFYLDKGILYTDLANASVSDKLYRRDVFAVGMKKKISRTFEIQCIRRGYYTLEKVEIISTDVFMMKKFLGEITCFQDFYVYPKKIKSDRIRLPYQRIMGDMLVHKKLYEDPFSFGGIRDYVNTDPMNHINWKATAKSQDLVVNMYESSQNQKVMIVLDTYGNKSRLEEGLNEEAIRIAAALAERLLMQGVEVTLLGNARDIITKKALDIQQYKGLRIEKIKQQLARLERGHEDKVTTLVDRDAKDIYVVLISKNLECKKEYTEAFGEYLWIAPYKNQGVDTIEKEKNMMLWELESGDYA